MIRLSSFVSFLSLLPLTLFSQFEEVKPIYGSVADASKVGALFTTSSKIGYDAGTNPAVLGIGYFRNSYDLSGVKDFNSTSQLDDLLSNFTLLSSGNFSASGPGMGYTTLEGSFLDGYIGDDPTTTEIVETDAEVSIVGATRTYLLTLSGVSEWEDARFASEFGLFGNPNDILIPAGGVPPTDYDVRTYDLLTVYGGSVYEDEDLNDFADGVFVGYTGHIYASQAVPEPSTYALFLGIFSMGFVYWRKRTAKSASQE